MLQLVIGGAHQGKWAYVKTRLLHEKTHYLDGHDAELNLQWPEGAQSLVFNGLHHWLRRKLALDEEVFPMLEDLVELSRERDLIIITDDISSGLVSTSPLDRRLREQAGLVNQYLAGEAQVVRRVVAGIPIILKEEREVGDLDD
ncbi:MAG: bifunctional adenosylcobinamide kinase/adenosylcobinamide-phosphate guanylyltransferase [Eubacteriales bacterium]|nr:bifunctional adenosylcobinamide kinase/adenosylcobinamide-phosphate guanylyltransferase [Eubacteriales bacterium]